MTRFLVGWVPSPQKPPKAYKVVYFCARAGDASHTKGRRHKAKSAAEEDRLENIERNERCGCGIGSTFASLRCSGRDPARALGCGGDFGCAGMRSIARAGRGRRPLSSQHRMSPKAVVDADGVLW